MTNVTLTPAEETLLRSIGSVLVFALLGYLGTHAADLAPVIGIGGAGIIALIANALDSAYSPNGTVLAGTIGTPQR